MLYYIISYNYIMLYHVISYYIISCYIDSLEHPSL